MPDPASITQCFYDYLDLSESDQNQWLESLQRQNSALYQQLVTLLASKTTSTFSLSQLLTDHAQTWSSSRQDYSNLRIDKYQLTEEIGRGGVGVVYAAHRADDSFEQQLAVKFIQPTMNQVLGSRILFNEAQLLAKLNHPAIAKVFDGGIYNDQVYMVMERIDGLAFNTHLQHYQLNLRQRLQLFSQLCRAIEHAHDHQILHADLKPENILVTEQHQLKLIDFNLTQKLREGHGDKPQFEFKAYSADYASPEQKRGDYLTQQSDVYSLGKVLASIIPVASLTPTLTLIINQATADHTTERYQTVGELRQDIDALLAHRPIKKQSDQPWHVLSCFIRRRPMLSALSLLLVCLVMMFSYTLIEKNRQLQQEQQITEKILLQLTTLMHHAQYAQGESLTLEGMLDMTRRSLLSSQEIPQHIKQKLLAALVAPNVPKQKLILNCSDNPCQ
ncbi:serine/threonine protein kinase [Vibrio metschnikovii]|uniref:Serine/threonine protein kinase n=4 Tax=Bacteria TaxID=2 RepID=A0AAU6UQP5_UNCXX|nr:serine/threonine-protein kinase [Vibrio metschnikovii]EEX35829.1 serine/threonine protein kinase [Vibrio metschnikovii CIP 69.14]EKO3642413.1 serine/threonine protein kinase [Vibrio metschnikovii]SUP07798.1 serine/threonine protein kinase [Vibrio metschnikovii]SUP47274.1 serine/threonine protein kinase [Vibrio metschnikovii]